MTIVFHLHMNLTYIVGTLVDSLDGELLEVHLLSNHLLQSTDGSIHRTIARRGSLKLLTSNIQTDAGYALHTLAGGYLQPVELNTMLVGSISTSEHQYILVSNFLFLISQLEELLVYLVELLLVVDIHTVDVETILQSSTTRTGCQYDSVIVETHILRIDNLVGLHILQDAILMDTR